MLQITVETPKDSTPVRNPCNMDELFYDNVNVHSVKNTMEDARGYSQLQQTILNGAGRGFPGSAGVSPEPLSESDDERILLADQKAQVLDSDDNDEEWDTDLEDDDGKEEYDATGRATYIAACKDCGVTPASYYLRNMKSNVLMMSHHGLGAKGAKALAVSLMTNTSVISLNLCDNGLGSEGTAYICEMLKENCYLSDIDLSENKIGIPGLISLCDVVQNTNNIKRLRLNGNDFDAKCAVILAEAVGTNTSLKYLSLSRNSFDQQSGQHLGPAIGTNDWLEELDLSWNHLRYKGALAVALSIKTNTSLKTLNLSWNGFGNDGALAIAEALKSNSSLLELDLSNNRITPEGAINLAKGLIVNDTLRVLKVGRNPMQTHGAYTILNAIKSNPNSAIIEIELTDIQVNSDFYQLLEEVRLTRPSLIVSHGGAGGAHGKGKDRPKPMKILKDYVKENQIRLLDFFSQTDKDKSLNISVREFVRGLKQAGIPLRTDELYTLISSLDKDNDGEINYSELVFGSAEQNLEERKDKIKERAKQERERQMLAPENLRPTSPNPRILSGRNDRQPSGKSVTIAPPL